MSSQTVLGTCHHDCPDSCGWVATIENGVAVKLRGNPAHPYSRGELCPKVNRFLDRVYSPDRLLYPLVRTGPKGLAQFERVSWDTALNLVARRITEIVAEWGGEAILPWWDAGTQGLIQMSSLDRRFFGRLGASRLVGSLCGATAGAGTAATNGTGLAADPMNVRFSEARSVVGNQYQTHQPAPLAFRRRSPASRGAQVVVIDPIRTATAQAADWFLQPLPGTDIALMLAMMHVLIRDDLIDQRVCASPHRGVRAANRAGGRVDSRAGRCGVRCRRLGHRTVGSRLRHRPSRADSHPDRRRAPRERSHVLPHPGLPAGPDRFVEGPGRRIGPQRRIVGRRQR